MNRIVSMLMLCTALVLSFASVPAQAEQKSRYSVKSAAMMARYEKRVAINNAHRENFALGDFARLDREMNELQAQYEKGEWLDEELWNFFFNPLGGVSPGLEETFNAWLKAYPKSYAARQGRGIYYYRRMTQFMGGAVMLDQVPAQTAERAKQYAELAFKDNVMARALTAKPMIADTLLISLQGMLGATDQALKTFARIDKICPDSTTIRYTFMSAMYNSGASADVLRAILYDARKRGFATPDISMINYIFYKKLLTDGKYDELDKELNQMQKDYESGVFNDITLMVIYSVFEDYTDAELAGQYNAWVKAYPKSYAARMARALYYASLAGVARGEKYMKDTTAEEVQGMELYVGHALKDSEAAIALAEKPILSYKKIVELSQMTGDDSRREAAWKAALAIDPENFIVRQIYLNGLQTKWGGSSAQMQAFMEDVKKLNLPSALLSELDDLMTEDKEFVLYRAEDMYKNTGQFMTGL